MKVLVTGSSGLIGSEAVRYFDRRGVAVYGIDNNMRADFFGPQGDTTWNLQQLEEIVPAVRAPCRWISATAQAVSRDPQGDAA